MATESGVESGAPVLTRGALEAEALRLEVLDPADRLEASHRGAVLEQRAREAGHQDLELRARLVQAVASGRSGEMAASTRTIREINRWAIEHDHRYLIARTHRHLSHATRLMGEFGISLEHAVRAVELDDAATPPRIRLDHQHVLAIALARSGHWHGAQVRFDAMQVEAEALGEHWLQALILNNLAYLNHIAGRLDQAHSAVEKMVSVAHRYGLGLAPAWIDTYARVALDRGDPERAVGFMEEHFDDGVDDVIGVADCYLTLAQAQRQTGLITRAFGTLDRCEQIARHQNLMEIQTRVLRERAELYAAQGRYREAFEEHRRFAAAREVLQREEQDGRAKVAAAVFETAEARRETERFRDLSQQDPLTGLRNRRYVDERLPHVITNCLEHGLPICVALLDLDNFKLINDRCSHEVGDQVLKAVAGVLRQATDGVGFAARMGGEEFLIVLPAQDRVAALATCEDVRERLREHPWERLHEDLTTVTASAGIGCSELLVWPGQTDLLRDADSNLYRAKHAGRDRVLAGVVTGHHAAPGPGPHGGPVRP